MSEHGAQIHDYDSATGNVLIAGGAVDTAAGVALVALSEPIHIAIGVVLIVFGLFLFTWAAIPHKLDKYGVERWLFDDHEGVKQRAEARRKELSQQE